MAEDQQQKKIQHIWCSATINKKMEDVLVSWICNQAQNAVGISEYVIYLSTFGGSPHSAVNLYNFFKSIPQKTTAYNMGNIFSAGVPFFLGFQKRIGYNTSLNSDHWLRCKNVVKSPKTGGQNEEAKSVPERVAGQGGLGSDQGSQNDS